MTSTLLIVGYGPGISRSVAERFAAEGYRIALVARDRQRVEDAAAELRRAGVTAAAYLADAGDPAAVGWVVERARGDLGPIGAVLWTAFGNGGVRNVLATPPERVGAVFDIGVAGLLACAQATLEDLASSRGVLLVANGALGEHAEAADGYAVQLDSDGVALENAAKSKLVGILAERLRDRGIYVGEVMVAGSVAGTETAQQAAIQPSAIADRFWTMAHARDVTRVRMTPSTHVDG